MPVEILYKIRESSTVLYYTVYIEKTNLLLRKNRFLKAVRAEHVTAREQFGLTVHFVADGAELVSSSLTSIS
jgi:hypothetical protein